MQRSGPPLARTLYFVLFVHPFYQEVNPWDYGNGTILTHPENFPVICLSGSVWGCLKSCSTPSVYGYATHAWHVTSCDYCFTFKCVLRLTSISDPRRRWVSSLSASGSCATLEPLHRTSLQSRQGLRFLPKILETSRNTGTQEHLDLDGDHCLLISHPFASLHTMGYQDVFLPGCHDVFVHKEGPEEASSWQLIQQVNHQL